MTALKGDMPTETRPPEMYSDFWEAARNLHFQFQDGRPTDEEFSQFMDALGEIFAGDLEKAGATLQSLVERANDEQVIETGLSLLGILYQETGNTAALLELADGNPGLVERGVIEEGTIEWARLDQEGGVPKMEIDLPDGRVTLPIDIAFSGTPMLDIEINGVHEKFWLDTGSSGALIASDVAEAAGIEVGEMTEVDNLGTKLQLRLGMVDLLKAGPMTVKNLPVAVLDKSLLGIGPRRIAGIIGWPVLRELRMEFDCRNKRLTLEKSQWRASPKRNFFWIDYPMVRLYTPEGVALNFGLDTGSDVSRIKTNVLKKLVGAEPSVITARRGRIGRVWSEEVQMLDEARFLVADAELNFQYIKTTDGVSARFIAPDGRLGMDVFRDAIVIVDYPAGVFRIEVGQR